MMVSKSNMLYKIEPIANTVLRDVISPKSKLSEDCNRQLRAGILGMIYALVCNSENLCKCRTKLELREIVLGFVPDNALNEEGLDRAAEFIIRWIAENYSYPEIIEKDLQKIQDIINDVIPGRIARVGFCGYENSIPSYGIRLKDRYSNAIKDSWYIKIASRLQEEKISAVIHFVKEY